MSLESTYAKAKLHTVLPRSILGESDGRYCVVSSVSGRMYDVVLRGHNVRECNCQCRTLSHSVCSHLMAAAMAAIEKKGYGVVEVVKDRPEGKYFKLGNTFLVVEENETNSG